MGLGAISLSEVRKLEEKVLSNFSSTNLVNNADFSNGTENWIIVDATGSVDDNALLLKGSGASASPFAQNTVHQGFKTGDKLYVKIEMEPIEHTPLTMEARVIQAGQTFSLGAVESPTPNEVQCFSGIISAVGDTDLRLRAISFYSGSLASKDKVTKIQKAICINLTTTFGQGNEPDIEEIELLLEGRGWFGGTVAPFVDNRQLYTMVRDVQEELKGINFVPGKAPVPAKVTPNIYEPGGTVITYGARDSDGVIWGVRWDNRLYKVDVDGTFTNVLDLKDFLNEGETCSQYGLRVSETGRIIVGTNKGRVLVSNEEKTSFTEAFTFRRGHTQNTWGYDQQGPYILMGAYVLNKAVDGPGTEVFMSKDHGATWECIFDWDINDIPNPADCHIHDVAFDPYSNAILVVTGDGVNNQIFYSYDLGATWAKTNPHGKSKLHPTSILCFPNGIAFGTDDRPEGIYWWERPKDTMEPVIRDEDIRGVKLFNIGQPEIGNIAVKGDTLLHDGNLYGVIAFVNHQVPGIPGNPRLFATGDGGRSWHEIYKEMDGSVKGFFNVLLREENDKVIIYANYASEGMKIFRAEMPEFVTAY